MLSTTLKPDRGRLVNWRKRVLSDNGYWYEGVSLDHPQFKGRYMHTSLVFNETENEDGTITVETLNSIYHLV